MPHPSTANRPHTANSPPPDEEPTATRHVAAGGQASAEQPNSLAAVRARYGVQAAKHARGAASHAAQELTATTIRQRSPAGALGVWAVTAVFVLAVVLTSVGVLFRDRSQGAGAAAEAARSSPAPEGSPVAAASPAPEGSPAAVASPAPSASSAALLVHVLGRVAQPGVVRVPAGARLSDAVDAAGGLLPDAELRGTNLARPIADGEQVYVPAIGEEPVAAMAAAGLGSSSSLGDAVAAHSGSAAVPAVPLVNLNTATAAELETLPRVGPALAQRILDWRQQSGPFTSVDDLLQVSGIGEKTLAGFRERVTV